MNTRHSSRPNMIGHMTEDDSVGQGRRDVLGQGDSQPRLDFQPQLVDVRVSCRRLLHVMPTSRGTAAVAGVGGLHL